MRNQILIAIALVFVSFYGLTQKSLAISRCSEKIELDGQLKEANWQLADVADSFIINFPTVGTASKFETKVRMLYDDEAIYIGADLYDPRPDSMLTVLSARDDVGNADWFGVIIDPYGAGQNGFAFYVTAAGVEIDAIRSQDNEDLTWNAVWSSRVNLNEWGWSVEIKIPLTQLRFPKEELQHWKVNFQRQIRRNRESSFWNPVDPTKFGDLAQSGNLTNLVDLRSPLRLSFSPYTTAYLENFYNLQTGLQDWRFRQRFGMDMKLGLSEAFTLDATLIPDFGQTVSDNLVLNLSPFEIRYNENRPFFLEGMDLFGIGDVFYTRRIGAEAYLSAFRADSLTSEGNKVISAPSQAQLLNAFKISGRTAKGTGIGVFNAIEGRSTLVYEDSLGNQHEMMAHPLSNYNVLVVSQNLRNNGSASLINTNVIRPEADVLANVSVGQFQFLTKDRGYAFSGNGRFSYNQRGTYSDNGYGGTFNFSKVKGNNNFGLDLYTMSDSFDPNELGYLERNNYQGISFYGSFNNYEPKGEHLLRRRVGYTANLDFLNQPFLYQSFRTSLEWIGTFKNFLTCGVFVNASPFHEVDHFESRRFGNPVNRPGWFNLGGWYSSNYSKRVALDFSLAMSAYKEKGMVDYEAEFSPRFRVSNKLFIVPRISVSRYYNNFGFVYVNDSTYANSIMLGTRDRWIVNNAISADYTFTNRISMKVRLNHYWQEVTYSRFNTLGSDGNRQETAYSGLNDEGTSLHNTSFNAFTIDMNFGWVVYPGSQILFVWKYNIYASKNGNYGSYFNVFTDLFEQPQLNSFSIKALFFIDAGKWIKKSKK